MKNFSDDSSGYEVQNVDDQNDNSKKRKRSPSSGKTSKASKLKKHSKRSKSAKKNSLEHSKTLEIGSINNSESEKDYYENCNQQLHTDPGAYQAETCVQDSSDERNYQNAQFDTENSDFKTHSVGAQEFATAKTTYQYNLSDEDNKELFHKHPRFSSTPDDPKNSNKESSDGQNTFISTARSYNKLPNKTVPPEWKRHKLNDTTEDEDNFAKKLDSNVPCSNVAGENKAQRIMRIMGYQQGLGLGKKQQGRLEPVKAHKQYGRSGVGHQISGLKAASLKWDPEEENIQAIEDIVWLNNTHKSIPTSGEMQNWLMLGPKKETIHDEMNFCDPTIVESIMKSKTVFDQLGKVQMRQARARSNPFETIRGAFFLNRAAVKMANIDRACNFMFTSPEGLKSNKLLYFADVCAGPGGFSEYVLWRKKWRSKGFGFTLKNENDFKLSDFYAASCETFHPYYGPKENGDVFDPSNQKALKNIVMKHTNGEGVHFMMSDGGFSVEGQENIQEILSKQLYLCQCLVALMIVRPKGHFVTKLFDLFTPFSAGLVYLMYRCFEEVSIFKPNSSRPANSERYLICKLKRTDTHEIEQHLSYVNELLLRNDGNNDVIQLVPLEELEREGHFLQYLRASNDDLGKKQIIALCKIAAFCEDSTRFEPQQAEMRKQCLAYWKIPDKTRTIPRTMSPQDKLKLFLQNTPQFLSTEPQKLSIDNIHKTILELPYDWFCLPCGSGPYSEDNRKPTFYYSMGRKMVYRYNNRSWTLVNEVKLDLPADTLVYGEIVYEFTRDCRNQQKILALHIMDAFILNKEDINKKYLEERHELTKLFCDALWKPLESDFARIRVKDMYPVDPFVLSEKFQLKRRTMKTNRTALTYDLTKSRFESSDQETQYFLPNSMLFLKSTMPPWRRHFGKKHGTTYVYNMLTKASEYDERRPAAAEASFVECFKTRILWNWPSGEDQLSMETVIQLINEKCPEFKQRLVNGH